VFASFLHPIFMVKIMSTLSTESMKMSWKIVCYFSVTSTGYDGPNLWVIIIRDEVGGVISVFDGR